MNKEKQWKIEQLNVELQKAISIIILLENDLLIQNEDGVGAYSVKAVNDILNTVQQSINSLFTDCQ